MLKKPGFGLDQVITYLFQKLIFHFIFVFIHFSDKSEAQEMLKDIEASESQSCLAMIGEWEELPVEMEFKTISCFEPNNYVCEVRVQTVTYYAWFIANWFSVLMVNITLYILINQSTLSLFTSRYSLFSFL